MIVITNKQDTKGEINESLKYLMGEIDEIPKEEKLESEDKITNPDDVDEAERKELEEDKNEETEEELEENKDPNEDKDKEEDKKVDESKETVEKKNAELRRESIRQYEKNKRINEAVQKGAQISEVSDEDIKAYYPDQDLDLLDSVQKQLMKDNILNKKRLDLIAEAANQNKALDDRLAEVDTFVADTKIFDKFPHLKDNEEKFKGFAVDKKFKDYDLNDVAALFATEVVVKPRHKGSLFESSRGGERPNPNTTEKITSAEELSLLRRTNNREYQRLIKTGKADVNID